MPLVPEPVLWLPHQLQILANLILLILALIVSFLAVWNFATPDSMLPVLRTLRVWHTWACFGFQTGALSGLVIANRIINLLPWTCPSDFVFMSNPCGNFMLSLILKDNSCCQLSASITRFLRTDLADFILMSLPLREFHVDSGFDKELLLPTFLFSLPGSWEPICGLYLLLINHCWFNDFWCWCFEILFLQTWLSLHLVRGILKTSS